MKKFLFLLVALLLCLGSAMANDVGKLQPPSTTTTVEMQHNLVSAEFTMVSMEIAPVISVEVGKLSKTITVALQQTKSDPWRNPDYGSILIVFASNIQRTGLNSKLVTHGLITNSRTWNYNVNNSYGLRY